jgi:hypothetical protein
MTRRNFATGVLGWAVPGVVALLFAGRSEDAGGETALLVVAVWVGLGVIGCAVAGATVGAALDEAGTAGESILGGLAGVATAWIAAVAASVVIETVVKVLHLGAVTFLLPIPFVISYAVGFALSAMLNRQDA